MIDVNVTREEEQFNPIKVELMLNSKKDVEKIYALFNHSSILGVLDMYPVASVLRKQITKVYGIVDYQEPFDKLQVMINNRGEVDDVDERF